MISDRRSPKQTRIFSRGDAVLIRTGWSKLMGKENQRYGSVSPGIGIAAAQWLVGQEPMLIAADNCCVEVRPSEPPHQSAGSRDDADSARHLLDRELWSLRRWRTARVYEFAFIVQPLKIKGATGSAVAPIAVR